MSVLFSFPQFDEKVVEKYSLPVEKSVNDLIKPSRSCDLSERIITHPHS